MATSPGHHVYFETLNASLSHPWSYALYDCNQYESKVFKDLADYLDNQIVNGTFKTHVILNVPCVLIGVLNYAFTDFNKSSASCMSSLTEVTHIINSVLN